MVEKNSLMDNRSKEFVFVPFCVLGQAFQAQGLVKYEWHGTLRPVMELLVKKDVNIIQLPCPETLYFGIEKGLRRQPLGIGYYDNPDFRKLCHSLAKDVVKIIEGLLKNEYSIVGILGIEYSPSCAVKLQYTNRGTIHKKGIFIEELENLLREKNIEIPMVGINRRGIKKSLERINNLFKDKLKQEKLF